MADDKQGIKKKCLSVEKVKSPSPSHTPHNVVQKDQKLLQNQFRHRPTNRPFNNQPRTSNYYNAPQSDTNRTPNEQPMNAEKQKLEPVIFPKTAPELQWGQRWGSPWGFGSPPYGSGYGYPYYGCGYGSPYYGGYGVGMGVGYPLYGGYGYGYPMYGGFGMGYPFGVGFCGFSWSWSW